MEQAKRNLEMEIPAWDFDKVKNDGREIWNNALGKIKIEGGTDKQKTIFYSALYRVMLGSQTLLLRHPIPHLAYKLYFRKAS